MTATEWAREHGEHYAGYVALDNYEPMPRSIERIECYRYSTDDFLDAYVLDHVYHLRDATRAVYLMDDGTTVAPYYVAGYHQDHQYVIIHPFPVNVNADGTPRMRADRDEQVNHDMWQLGPRRAYHVKLRAL